MAEYIDREEYCEEHCRCNNEYCDKKSCQIWKAPAADVAPVRHGRWKLLVSGNGVCSVCHFTTVHVWDFDSSLSYCPHCGAMMDGDGNG